MQATSVDLRFHTKQIFEALDRGEKVELLQRGKLKGTIVPASALPLMRVEDHPYFGSEKADRRSVKTIMKEIRKPRFSDL